MFGRQLSLQLRVIVAVMFREMQTRYGRANIGFAWLIAEPLCFALPVLAMWSVLRSPYERGGLPMFPFVWTGYLPLLMFRHVAGRAIWTIRANMDLLFHRQVTPFDLFVGRLGLEAIGALLAAIVSFFILMVLGVMDWPKNPPLFYLGWFLSIWWALAVALLVAPLSERSDIVEKTWPTVSYMYMPVSGFMFLATWLPAPIRHWVLIVDPPLHMYETIRAGYFGPSLQTFQDPVYLSYILAVMTLVGLVLLRDARRHLVLG
jgi:capsular polysaccharide transport system permease protein